MGVESDTVEPAPPAAVAILAEQIRLARQEVGLTQNDLAAKIHYSDATVSMIETGQRVPQLEMVQLLDDAFGTGERLQRMWRHAVSESAVARIAELADAEQRAISISCYEPVVVVGLLQTEQYAREILNNGKLMGVGDDVVEGRVAARMQRQEILASDSGPALWVVLGEAALRNDFGAPEMMRNQLHTILKWMHTSRVNLQVLPFGADVVMSAPMEVMDLGGTSIVYVEDPLIGRTISGKSRVMDYVRQFDVLRAQALSLRQSVRLIEQRLEEL